MEPSIALPNCWKNGSLKSATSQVDLYEVCIRALGIAQSLRCSYNQDSRAREMPSKSDDLAFDSNTRLVLPQAMALGHSDSVESRRWCTHELDLDGRYLRQRTTCARVLDAGQLGHREFGKPDQDVKGSRGVRRTAMLGIAFRKGGQPNTHLVGVGLQYLENCFAEFACDSVGRARDSAAGLASAWQRVGGVRGGHGSDEVAEIIFRGGRYALDSCLLQIPHLHLRARHTPQLM